MNQFKKLSIPYQVWLYILALAPMLVMVILSFLETEGVRFEGVIATFSNFQIFLEPSTLFAFRDSFLYAGIATVICIFLGYFIAYRVFRSNFKNKFTILTIIILPMWSNLLLRTESLGNILSENNIITSISGAKSSLDIKGTGLAVVIGLVFTYLPFMILPIYTALEKIEFSLEEAAADLGLTEFKTFRKVVLPLSMKGVITGSIMVFLPTFSGFVIPEIMSQGNINLIGNIIEQSFRNMNYNVGALLSIVILIVILGALLIINKVDKDGEMIL